jgi:hypothetical protein
MAHWQFAFEYFRLSYKTKLRNDKRPVDTNQCLLDTLNYFVSAVIILLAAADPLYSAFYEYGKVGKILFGTVYLFIVVALLFMSYGLWLLTKIAKFNDTQANAGTMSIHIVAYVLVILAQGSFYIDKGSEKAYEITTISFLIT